MEQAFPSTDQGVGSSDSMNPLKNGHSIASPSFSSSSSPSRSPTPPLTPPEPIAPLESSLLQSIHSSYPVPITLPFPPPSIDPQKRTVCKHWLRGLCKKSDSTCDYLHEYDMRKMPECRMFATFGFCNNGEECLYRHKAPKEKRRECEEYKRGFCPLGPECNKKHVRRIACPYYLAGFCPKGPDCDRGHPKATAPSAASRRSSPILSHKPLTVEEAFGPPPHLREGGNTNTNNQNGTPFDTSNQNRPQRNMQQNQGMQRNNNQAGGGRFNPGQQQQQQQPGGGMGGGRRDLSTVLCFRCGEHGHFANNCPNPMKPGDRGGLSRNTRG
ncbi:unnamed protein product [Sympodiomycopsis kandeliae]